MPHANSKSLPTLDYVSTIVSLYKDRRAMVVGTSSTVAGAVIAAVHAQSVLLGIHALILLILLITRDFNMRAFARAEIGVADLDAARYWERRALFFGYFAAIAYGSWVFSAIAFAGDPFAELVSISVTVAAMVGIVTRNYGVDRLMTVQILGMGGLMVLGLVVTGNLFYILLATLFLPMLVSFRSLGADVRNNLLNAVHDRVAASKLADQLDTALETMQHGLCMLDKNGVIAIANEKAQQTFQGVTGEPWVGRVFADLLSEAAEKGAMPRSTVERLLALIEQRVGGKVVMKLSGDTHCEVTVSSREDRTVLLFEDVTARVRADERINFMARYDSLTGLPNRAHFTEQVEADIAGRWRKGQADPAMLMIVDLDDFKHINDSLGHLAGDKVLIETAARIQSVLHRSSQLARLGGDEFVVYRSAGTGRKAALEEAAAVLDAINRPYDVGGERIDMRTSIGYVLVEAHQTSLDDLTTRADLALYRAKARGKGQFQEFIEEMDGEFRYRQRLKADLHDAITQNQLKVVYQPLIDIRTRRVAGCEALVRWTHPELGPIPPMTFISLAEDMGLISEITRYVLEAATAECTKWPGGVSVSVNVSGRDLRTDALNGYVAQALAKSGLTPERLEVEVTETALIEERDVAAERLRSLVERGIGIALDDFGTGYSSLSYLHEMPFTKLKIDRSFVADIATSKRSLRLLANVARLGKDLDLVLTAEGVETQEQLDIIAHQTGIDQAQGYLFGMPLPASEIGSFINAQFAIGGDTKPVSSRRASV